jgi:hypothetical protein
LWWWWKGAEGKEWKRDAVGWMVNERSPRGLDGADSMQQDLAGEANNDAARVSFSLPPVWPAQRIVLERKTWNQWLQGGGGMELVTRYVGIHKSYLGLLVLVACILCISAYHLVLVDISYPPRGRATGAARNRTLPGFSMPHAYRQRAAAADVRLGPTLLGVVWAATDIWKCGRKLLWELGHGDIVDVVHLFYFPCAAASSQSWLSQEPPADPRTWMYSNPRCHQGAHRGDGRAMPVSRLPPDNVDVHAVCIEGFFLLGIEIP